jgi:hypothetical protein
VLPPAWSHAMFVLAARPELALAGSLGHVEAAPERVAG